MLIKWIRCRVEEAGDGRGRFSRGQESWSVLRKAPGFLGQVGGWETPEDEYACVLGLWENAESYEKFMQGIHDDIFENSGQKGSYVHSAVRLYEIVSPIEGAASRLESWLSSSGVIRIAKCRLYEGREAHFEQTQREHWGPGMRASGGMLGGLFAKSVDILEYIVITGWKDLAAHEHYMSEHFRRLHASAGVGKDVCALTGQLLLVEPAWRVLS